MSIRYLVGAGGISVTDLGDVVFLGDLPGLTARADGSAGTSGLEIQDEAGALDLTGLNKFVAEEAACSNPRIFTGISAEREVSRGSYSRGAGRVWDMNVVDQNAFLRLRIIRDGNHGNRPAETDVARVGWLLDEVLRAGHVANGTGGLWGEKGPTAGVLASPRMLDAADYRKQYAEDVLADIGPPGNRRFFCYWDPTIEKVCLFYGLQTESLADSTLRISNVASDANSVTFAPFQDASLDRDPSLVYGGILYTWRHGKIYREDPTTIGTFLDRSVSIENDKVGLASTASNFVDRLLEKASAERDTLKVTVIIPADKVNLAIEGMRMSVRFTHLPAYESFRWMHIVSRTVLQEVATNDFYSVQFELADYIGGLGAGGSGGGGPFVPGDVVEEATCSGAYTITPTQHFSPLGAPGTSDADGLVAYGSGTPPAAPLPGHTSVWGFPVYGGPGGPDYAGDCTLSALWFIIVGAGTLQVQTAVLGSGTGMHCTVHHWTSGGASTEQSFDVTPNSLVTIVLPSDGSDDCVHTIAFTDGPGGCGGAWGWSGADWTSGTVVADTPAPAQQVTEAATGDGSTTNFGTNYPYYPNSLVVHVGGVAVVPTQTDPMAGTFTLPFAPPAGTQILITYQAASGTLTGAGNDPEPPSTTPTVPPDVLGPISATLDDLSDVVITSAAAGDRLRFDGTNWVNDTRLWKPVMDGLGNVVTDSGTGDAIMAEVVP